MGLAVERVGVSMVSVPLPRVVSGSGYTKATRNTVVVDVETTTGVTSRVYAGDERDEQRAVAEMIVDELAPVVVGEDPFRVERLWADLFDRVPTVDDPAVYMHALGALDTALWDTIGCCLDEPLYRIWGGYRDSLPLIAIGGYYEENRDPSELAAEAREYEAMGLAGMKLKVGGATIDGDIERLRRVTDATTDGFEVACDSNRAWSVAEAVEFAERARPFDIAWLEEPVAWFDEYRGMREVRRQTGVPVTAGQSEITPYGCRQLLDADAVDYLNFDASLGGGPTAWRKVAGAAHLTSVSMGHHEEPHVAMHLLASVPHGTFVECFHPDIDPVWYDLVENTPSPENGAIELPGGPGLGLNLNEEFLAEYTVDTMAYSA